MAFYVTIIYNIYDTTEILKIYLIKLAISLFVISNERYAKKVFWHILGLFYNNTLMPIQHNPTTDYCYEVCMIDHVHLYSK